MADNESSTDPGIEVRTYFARGRNALVARADFSELYAALYLHQMDTGLRFERPIDQLLRDALAGITLHAASKPRNETVAWTINVQDPLANVFVSGDNRQGTVVGTVFTENIREGSRGIFISDTVTDTQPPRRSVTEFSGHDMLLAVEAFYERSEQRPARLFRLDEEDIVLIAAQPDCDEDWLRGLDLEAARTLDQSVELGLLEQRFYRFECGCNQDRILNMLLPVLRTQADELFEDEEIIRVSCPRCGSKHSLTREMVEARLASEA